MVVNEEDTFVKVCLQRNGSVDQLEQSETVYIQAKEIQPGRRMWAHIRVDVCTAAAACRELIVYQCECMRTMSNLFIYNVWLCSCCTAEPMSGTGMELAAEEETATGK